MTVPAHDPLLYPPPSRPSAAGSNGNASSNRWGPYHSAGDFSATMALVLLILLCTLVFVLAFTATVRCLLRRRRSSNSPADPAAATDPEKQEPAGKDAVPEPAPTVAFTAAMELAGAAAECAICLSEFAEGERVRVLPACNHGFHVKCVEAWLASKPSCPTCRCSCQVASAGPPGRPQPSPSERA